MCDAEPRYLLAWMKIHREFVSVESCISFDLIHVNVGSLHKNWNMLQMYLENVLTFLEVIILTEINVSESDCSLYNIQNYQSYALCREGKRGGGVLVFVKNCWFCERLKVEFDEAEVIALYLSNNEEELFCLCDLHTS